MKKFSTIAILALMVVGCNNNYDNVEPTVEGTPMTIVATTADDAVEGRTALNTADGKTVVWKTGDKLGVFGQYNSVAISKDNKFQNEFTLTSGDGTASGEFEGVVAGLEDVETNVEGQYLRYNAYYPLNAANATKKQFQLVGTLNALQSYDVTAEYNDLSADDVLVGRYIYGTKEDTTIPFVLQHLFAMMTFEVSNPTAEPIVVNKVEMTTEEGLYLSGSYTLNLTKFPYGTQTAVFNSGSASVGVRVSNGSVAAGQKINARLIFNRWAATDGKALTVKVFTDKGTQTFNKTATDFSGNNSWGLRLALDTSKMEAAIVDNYDSATMKEMPSGNVTAGGTYCVLADINRTSGTSQLRTNQDITIIGRYTTNGVPTTTMKQTIIPCKNAATNYGNNLVVRDLIWKSSNAPYILRMNSPVGNLASLTIENCIIDCENNTGAPFVLADANYSIESVIIRNCTFINLAAPYAISFDGAGATNCQTFVFENNTINTSNGKNSAVQMIKLQEGATLPTNSTIQNNTIIATETATLSLKWASEEI